MNVLTALTLMNYKSILRAEIPLMPLTVIVGRNSAGKTGVLHALEFLRGLSEHTLTDTLQKAGGYTAIRTQLVKPDGISEFVEGTDAVAMDIAFSAEHHAVITTDGQTDIDVHMNAGTYSFTLKEEHTNHHVRYSTTECANVHGSDLTGAPIAWSIAQDGNNPLITTTYRPTHDHSSFPSNNDHAFHIRLYGLEDRLLLSREPFFLPPLRTLLQSCAVFNLDSREMRKAFIPNGLQQLTATGSNLAAVLHDILSDSEKREDFTTILNTVFPHISSVQTHTYMQQFMYVMFRESYAPLWDMSSSLFSDGTIYMIALIIILFFDDRPIAIIEEPDRYLHPALMRILASLLHDASQAKQVIITTHNPTLIRHIPLEHVLVVDRQHTGATTVLRVQDIEKVTAYLDNDNLDIGDIMIHDLFV